MSLSEHAVSVKELAETLNRSEGYLTRNWLKLHYECGLPRKNPAGLCWPRKAVEVWLAGGGTLRLADPDAPKNPAAISDLALRQREMLHARRAGRAA